MFCKIGYKTEALTLPQTIQKVNMLNFIRRRVFFILFLLCAMLPELYYLM